MSMLNLQDPGKYLIREINAMAVWSVMGEPNAYTPNRTPYVAFSRGVRVSERELTPVFDGTFDDLMGATLAAVKAYRAEIAGDAVLTWRQGPMAELDPRTGKTNIYLRLAFEPAAIHTDATDEAGAPLQATEDYSAARSTHPRVTLDHMQSRIAETYYFTVGGALDAISLMNSVSSPAPDSPLHLLTICVLVLDNGWVMTGKSAPAAPENFDAEKGRTFAYEDAIRQLWPLEGYLLRERLSVEGKG